MEDRRKLWNDFLSAFPLETLSDMPLEKYTNLNLKEAEHIFIHDFERKADYIAVAADSDMKDLISRAMSQNFVPVVDDQNKFIGIITRRSIIEYCYDKLNECDK